MKASIAIAIAIAVAASLGGCAVGPNYRSPTLEPPAEFASARPGPATSTATPELSSWWHSLEDPELDSLVDRAIRSNLDIGIALTRLQQARTYEALVIGSALPEVDASGAAGRGTGSDLTRGRATQPLVSADNAAGLQHLNLIGGFDAVWELDIFGRYRREFEAARADVQALSAARNTVHTSVVADVVRAYIDLRGFQSEVAIFRQARDVLQESLRIVKIRYERGITNELDVTLAARELATLEAELAPAEAQASAAQYTLAVLVGEYPETLTKELGAVGPVPTIPAAITPGLPLEVLGRRPDVQQAERELASATARIGVATANLFPQVALTGAVGVEAQGWGTSPSLQKHIWSFGPGAIWPVLDFGALDAQVDVADLEARAALLRYRRTILGAVEDVDSSMADYAAQQNRLQRLGEAMVAGDRAVELANQRYDRGLTDFLNVVDAERQLYDLQRQYVAAQVGGGEAYVRLYRSLGGGWQNYQAVPPIRRPQPAVVAALRRLMPRTAP